MYCGQTENIKRQAKTIRMECYRRILGENAFKVRNSVICKRIEMPESIDVINAAAAKMVHRTLKYKRPVQIYQQYQLPRRPRGIYPIRVHKPGSTIRTNRTLMYASLEVYNRVPEPLRCLEFPQFRRRIKTHKWPKL